MVHHKHVVVDLHVCASFGFSVCIGISAPSVSFQVLANVSMRVLCTEKLSCHYIPYSG